MSEQVSARKKEKIYDPRRYRSNMPNPACAGCGSPIVCGMIMSALEELDVIDKAIVVVGVGCTGMAFFGTKIDMAFCAHGSSPSVAAGIKHANYDDAIVFTIQGDGDCAAIGAGYLVNSAARADKITVFMCNNVNYGTTGGQMAPTTLLDQVTTTTPGGRDSQSHGFPLHVPEMLSTIQGVSYSARGSVSSAANYQRTKKYAKRAIQKQIDGEGLGFLEVLSACPVNWHMTPGDAAKWIDDTVMKEYPLGEFTNGQTRK
ncbi:MAG: thiamine pyrophosphate-dependent enzyme [Desulfatiglans sp.]|jgi:2-oxoglutarate ferredoxin oxidoreductase subunit beta|nr:thiamine pyrophosphate-dependent enzyme [Thermodesulfobacteriota bacterium]MEE4352183.1 thiamine pyrophosphate-dependent enzyme [Desulfatiglans sp.]